MAYLSLQNINKIFSGNIHIVFDFNLDVDEGEFIVLVGPSGCGKSTVMRMIAGLEGISSGDMVLQGKRINDLAPSDRNVAMVFQDYALYGNMTVYHNIGFSLTIRGEKQDKIHEKVMEVSKTVGLFEYLNRFPKALSGGQKQRVAMGRSIAKEAKILLMDEPLSNLDAKLRQQTRKELAMLHHELHPTVLYVTHDQIEAMTMATRIVVMKEGRIQQIGTPNEIYHYPANMFTASFIGAPTINFISGAIKENQFIGFDKEQKPLITFDVPPALLKTTSVYQDGGIVLGVRPETITIEDSDAVKDGRCVLPAEVLTLELLGAEYYAVLDVNGLKLVCRIPARHEIKTRQRMKVAFDIRHVQFFDEKTGLRIKYENN